MKDLFDGLVSSKKTLTVIYKCDSCKKEFKEGNSGIVEGLYFIYGNIMFGPGGGLVGGNFDGNGNLVRVSLLCKDCLKKRLFFEEEGE